MQYLSILFLIILQCLLMKSQQLSFVHATVRLKFIYSTKNLADTKIMSVTTHLIPEQPLTSYYILTADMINDKVFLIREIRCMNFHVQTKQCERNFETSNIMFQNSQLTEDHVLHIHAEDRTLRSLLYALSGTSFSENSFNFTVVLLDEHNSNNKPTNSYQFALSKTSLFGIIFLSICVVLVLILCFGWFALFYCRRFRQYRMKKKLRKVLAKSAQQMLNKSPVIIFDPKNRNSDQTDDDPTCAICLESFKAKEKLRKLVCSHHFHMTCIDPWLLSHQSCPLCNRNILRNSIPSISSSIMAAINERNNDESTSIAINENNQTIQAQY